MAVLLALALLQVRAFGSVPMARAGEAPESMVSQDEAVAAAKKWDKPVVVSSLTGAQREVRALPDGELEATMSSRPVRTRRGGKWVPVDTKLTRRSNGELVPGATTVGLAFSGGGDGPFARMTRAGRELALTWPYGRLPIPVVDGDTATYQNVLPDVDLVLRAVGDGFRHVLVVKTAAAAQRPELKELQLKLTADRLKVQGDGAGGLTAIDEAAGGTVFRAAEPYMWDSSGQPAGDGAAPSTPTQSSSRATPSPSPSSASKRSLAGPSEDPADGVQRAAVKTAVSGGMLKLTPDQALLTGTTTKFPVYIDPDWQGPGESAAVMVSTKYSDSSWEDEGMGYCSDSDPYMGGQCGGTITKRLFYKFTLPSAVMKTNVLAVEFKPYQTGAYNCTPAEAELWRTKGVSGSTSWNTQNASGFWQRKVAEKSFNYGNEGVGCANNTVVFQDARLKDEVQKTADGGGTLWLGLKAGSESSTKYWKRFNNDAVLRVLYNLPPKAPTNVQLQAEGGYYPCGANDASKPYVRVWPTMSAKITDPQSSDRVQAEFLVGWGDANGANFQWRIGAGGLGPDSAPLTSGGGNSGTTFTKSLSSLATSRGIPKNVPIAWMVRGHDFKDNQEDDNWQHWQGVGVWTDVATTAGGQGHKCWFVYDDANPKPPTITSTKYPNDGAEHDGVGQPGDFTVTAAADSEPLSKFGVQFTPPGRAAEPIQWKNLGASPSPGCTATQCTFSKTPDVKGDWKMDVWAVDRAGRPGSAPTYQFRIRNMAAEEAHWKLDDPAGSHVLLNEITGSDTFQIVSALSGKCFDVNGRSLENGPTGKTVQYDCDDGLSQRWRLDPVGGDDYKIVNMNSNKCADVGADGDGAQVWQWGCYDTTNQIWTKKKRDDGFELLSKRSGRCVDVLGASTENNATIVQWTCDGSDRQLWKITSINNTYSLVAAHSDKCFDVNGKSTENGPTGKTVQYECDGGLSQRWRLDPMGGDDYKLVNVNSNKCADVGADGDGAQVWQWGCYDTTNQVWTKKKRDDGFELVSKRSGRCIDVFGASTANNATIVQWGCDGSDRQLWKITSVNTAKLVGTDYTTGNPARIRSTSLVLNSDSDPGSFGYAEMGVPLINPAKSFSVSVWAKLTKDEGYQTVLSQDGLSGAAFQLKYVGGTRGQADWTNKWAAVVRTKDGADATVATALSDEQVRVGQWVHLVAVHDANAKNLTLYINGKSQSNPAVADMSTWTTSRGKFAMGRTLTAGSVGEYFSGEIDDVRVFDRAVTLSSVTGWYRPTVQARWRLNSPAGTDVTVPDDSGAGHALTLQGGAEIKTDDETCVQLTGRCLALDGARTGGGEWAQADPVVRTDGSFTIAGWVDAAKPTVPMTVFSAAGTEQSAFTVRFNPRATKNPGWDPDRDDPADEYLGKWEIEMPSADGDNPVRATAYHGQPCNVCTDSGPDHLALTYDAATGTMTLFVNGAVDASATNSSAKTGVIGFNATGPVQIGRRFADGQTADDHANREYLSGLVDDVWMFKGALDTDGVSQLVNLQEIATSSGNPSLPCTYDETTLQCPDD
ncbi:RICIN domain-containing protein [Actinomadura litoris]|uniref:RICIN domain-containing protein n=1 Tax=Actinomadura litoris TaxID=2678616 RepID=UPI001564075E|nr:RICIN domain-containing protein [Actinomadura litoris]